MDSRFLPRFLLPASLSNPSLVAAVKQAEAVNGKCLEGRRVGDVESDDIARQHRHAHEDMELTPRRRRELATLMSSLSIPAFPGRQENETCLERMAKSKIHLLIHRSRSQYFVELLF